LTRSAARVRGRGLQVGFAVAAALALAGGVVAFLATRASVGERPPASSRPAAVSLATLIDDVGAARGRRFGARDNTGQPLDTLKVVQAGPPRTYVGVYHAFARGHYSIRLATSSDLEHFTYAVTLAADASQPSISKNADGGFLAAWEKREPGGRSHLQFAAYTSLADLLDGQADRTTDVPRTLSKRSEGTPSFVTEPRSPSGPGASSEAATVGLHYYDSASGADRNAQGRFGPDGRLTVAPAVDLNASLGRLARGNIGDRDELLFRGHPYTVVEAQTATGDVGTWRLYLYDESIRRAHRLAVRTPAGSRAFGNPAITMLTDPAGRRALFVSIYVFAQGARGREAGPLIYYAEF
jgi:hypothetical protein